MLNLQREHNGIVVLATHDEEEIQNADRILLVQQGEISELNKGDISKGMLIHIYNEEK